MSEDGKKEENGQEQPASIVAPSWRKKRKNPEEPKKPPLWLLTFTDIMALMLTFFVLLYTMAAPKEEEWDELSQSLTQGLGEVKITGSFKGSEGGINIDKLDMSEALNLDYLESLVNDVIAQDSGLDRIAVVRQENELTLSLPVDLLFQEASANMAEQGKEALFTIAGPLSRIRNRIEVVGYPDQKVSAGAASYWETSMVRAARVAAILDKVGYTRPIVVRGLPKGMMGEAGQVDIVIMKDDGSKKSVVDTEFSG